MKNHKNNSGHLYKKTVYVNDYLPGPENTVELKNGRFADVSNGRFYDSHVRVFIRNGSIMINAKEPVVPDFSIDLNGRTVLPGLFNVHCHTQMVIPSIFGSFRTVKAQKKYHDAQVEKNMEECLKKGITNVRDAFSNDLAPSRSLKEKIRQGKIKGPRLVQSVAVGVLGGYLTPDLKGISRFLIKQLAGQILDYSHVNSGAVVFRPDAGSQEVRNAVDRAIDEKGAECIKVGESLEKSMLNPDARIMEMNQLETIADQAKKRGIQSTIHSVSVSTFRRALKAGFSSIAHVPRDAVLNEEDIKLFEDSDAHIDPTLSVGWDMSWKYDRKPSVYDSALEQLRQFRNSTFRHAAEEFWIPELRPFVTNGIEKANSGRFNMFGVINMSRLLAHFSRLAYFGFKNAGLLFEHGAVLSLCNDGGIQACTPAMAELELSLLDLVLNQERQSRAFDGKEAVKTATINSARSMGLENRFGLIENGKTADFAIFSKNPYQDFSILGKNVDALFMDGRLVINNCGLKVTPC